jgi:phage terminase large subunit-like protein
VTYSETALGYARAVVSGDIPACLEVRQSCQRHLDDLERSQAETWLYQFDEAKAEVACSFIELLPHTKGEWAQRRELIVLQPWQVFIVCSIFGWVRKSDGTRRFRVVYAEIPRKNAKSTLASAIGLYMFVADGEHGAEVYSGATSEKQAWEIFRPAKQMCDKTPDLRDHYGIVSNAKNLSSLMTVSRFEPVIGKPGDGSSPSCALVDEFHEHQTPDLYDTMMTGMGARRQPLMLVVTTAGFDLAGPCYEMRGNVQQMLSGILPNETLFGIIYSVDEGDDWQDPGILRKANPNFGVSVGEEFLLEQQRDAIRYPGKTNAFLTKHLNKWVSARSAWLNIASWQACGSARLRMDDHRGATAFLGIDLASKSDIAAVGILLREVRTTEVEGRLVPSNHYRSFVRSYLPESAIERAGNNRAAYEKWRRTGHLIITDGDETNFDQIREDVKGLAARLQIEEIAYDPWRATQLAQQLAADGASVIEVRNTVQNLSPAMREMETAVIAGRWEHPDDPCLNWMMSNVTVREDANRNIFPRKERPENKIDGALALLMALSRAVLWVPPKVSIYETRGVLTL